MRLRSTDFVRDLRMAVTAVAVAVAVTAGAGAMAVTAGAGAMAVTAGAGAMAVTAGAVTVTVRWRRRQQQSCSRGRYYRQQYRIPRIHI
jgi:hypothetical protein